MIKLMEERDFEIYETLNKKYGTIFTSLDWLKLFSPRVKLYGLYSKSKELVGGIIVYVEKSTV
ncbi:hypothetical protein SAMN06265339_1226 [Desulfurobacterium pacificum]|uniref:GNAT family N-acetyltransferase n=1 Tax=Desulfurobacterium pacificum TaxID=240166 RepID=A0ABY1NNE1_9BACT|nr:hypothetical protein [Desulfurobacterium pacificum]SMP14000.1 hypothetical protein SAMN06265339_1226 [Desulfurobacterium pacificum]